MNDTIAVRTRLLQRSFRFTTPLPDALMAVALALAAFVHVLAPLQDDLFFALVIEGGFLMMQATLVDIATRLKKRPPVWVIAIVVVGVLIFSEHAMAVLKMAWGRGMVVFIPLLISLAERGMVLWNLPHRTQTQKIAARALVSNRITTALGVLIAMVVLMVLETTFHDLFDSISGASLPLVLGAFYFAVAAYDDWRVRGQKFAEKPRVLFRFDPIHIEYLEPV